MAIPTMIILGGSVEMWGFIPGFLDPDDPRPVREQLNERYVAGWHPADNYSLDTNTFVLSYPGDPPFEVLSALMFKGEMLLLYPGEFVVILQKDGTWEVARMN